MGGSDPALRNPMRPSMPSSAGFPAPVPATNKGWQFVILMMLAAVLVSALAVASLMLRD
jgi:hypothetical protein